MISDSVGRSIARARVERDEGWREFTSKVPFITLPAGYSFSVIPPFGGAKARMIVRKDGGRNEVSVYLDDNCSLAYYCDENGNPKAYWEIYPADHGDFDRFDMDDVSGLVAGIVRSLNKEVVK